MSYSFQRKRCEDCGVITYHRRPETAPCLMCTRCQTSALADYDKQADKMRLMIELARDSVKPFPAYEAYKWATKVRN